MSARSSACDSRAESRTYPPGKRSACCFANQVTSAVLPMPPGPVTTTGCALPVVRSSASERIRSSSSRPTRRSRPIGGWDALDMMRERYSNPNHSCQLGRATFSSARRVTATAGRASGLAHGPVPDAMAGDVANDELDAEAGTRGRSVPAQSADPTTKVLYTQIFLEISIHAASHAAPAAGYHRRAEELTRLTAALALA
jgi:hypothetical protein